MSLSPVSSAFQFVATTEPLGSVPKFGHGLENVSTSLPPASYIHFGCCKRGDRTSTYKRAATRPTAGQGPPWKWTSLLGPPSTDCAGVQGLKISRKLKRRRKCFLCPIGLPDQLRLGLSPPPEMKFGVVALNCPKWAILDVPPLLPTPPPKTYLESSQRQSQG